ncbi:Ribosomal protein S6 kinase alpha-5 [Nowakowskiella sp. JEL0407]|nr:Ribosomal protein S6 kinase alpha-5 [Nowakowskiella sp. JEL0407]
MGLKETICELENKHSIQNALTDQTTHPQPNDGGTEAVNGSENENSLFSGLETDQSEPMELDSPISSNIATSEIENINAGSEKNSQISQSVIPDHIQLTDHIFSNDSASKRQELAGKLRDNASTSTTRKPETIDFIYNTNPIHGVVENTKVPQLDFKPNEKDEFEFAESISNNSQISNSDSSYESYSKSTSSSSNDNVISSSCESCSDSSSSSSNHRNIGWNDGKDDSFEKNYYLTLARAGSGGGKVFAWKVFRRKKYDIDACKEAETVKSLQHIFVVKFYDTIATPEVYRIFTEYCGDGTLAKHISTQSQLPQVQTQFFAAEILLGLNYIHKQGYILRDLKDHNIMLTDTGHIKLIDLGLAVLISRCKKPKYIGGSCGTVPYMSPEVAYGWSTYDEMSDMWSLGVIIYKMLTGKIPFKYAPNKDHYKNTQTIVINYEDPNFTEESKDICQNLLCKASKRLRAGKNGEMTGIFEHPFFFGVSWDNFPAWLSPLTSLPDE